MRDLKDNECPECMKQNGKFVKGKKLPITSANFSRQYFYIKYECPKGHSWEICFSKWGFIDNRLTLKCPICEGKGKRIDGKELEPGKVKGNIVEFNLQCPECGHKWTSKIELNTFFKPVGKC
jgi:endogenous inhibitor of DNA gyrase (YacG/DUF329 family)